MATLLKELYVGNVYGNWYLRLYEDSTSQSIDGNYSTVNLRLTLRADASTWVSFDARDAWIHGTHFSIAYRHDNPEHNLGSMSLRINHNADGTGSYSVGFGMATSYALNGSGAGGNVLPTIPRASTFSISGSTLGSAMTVNIARASASFTHTVRYQFGSITRDYTGQTTSCSFTPPLTDASQIPNNASGQGTMTVLTYSGSTHIGTKSLPFTQNLPASAVPSFSALNITRVDNGVPAAWGIYVKNKSKANVVISGATGIYGSTIKSYSISGGGYSANASSLSTGTLASGSITFTGIISDSRGRSATKTISITVYENTLPALSLKAERCDKNGSSSNAGTYLKITPTYSCASVNGKNSITSKTFTIAGTTYKNTTASSGTFFILGDGTIAISKSYDVTGVVVDALAQTSGTLTIKVPSSSVPMNLRDDQTGIAFGKYSEKQNAIDSAWPVYVNGVRLMKTDENAGQSNKLARWGVDPNLKNSEGLFYIQGSNLANIMPNSEWWHLIRMQHPGYANGYWTDLAAGFYGEGLKYRTNNNGTMSAWKHLAEDQLCPEIGFSNDWLYMKFQSGAVIQMREYTLVLSSTLSYGSLFYGYIPPVSNYPITFAGVPVTQLTLLDNYRVSATGFNSTASNFSGGKNMYIYDVVSRPGLTARFSMMAIGRWK